MPSAIVEALGAASIASASSERRNEAQPVACTPTISTSGRTARIAVATPDQAATADRHDDDLDVGHLLEQLEAERALPRDDALVVERRDEAPAGRGDALARRGLGVVERAAGELDAGAVAARRLHLRERGVDRHVDVRGHAQESCAASATPCAWLPALAATTPALRSAGVSAEIAL